MAGGALTREQFTAYAREQIAAIAMLLAGHRPAGAACSCGRPVPCPQAGSLTATREHYRRQLDWLERTQQLPVLAVPMPAGQRHRRRRVLPALLIRPWRSRRGDV